MTHHIASAVAFELLNDRFIRRNPHALRMDGAVVFITVRFDESVGDLGQAKAVGKDFMDALRRRLPRPARAFSVLGPNPRPDGRWHMHTALTSGFIEPQCYGAAQAATSGVASGRSGVLVQWFRSEDETSFARQVVRGRRRSQMLLQIEHPVIPDATDFPKRQVREGMREVAIGHAHYMALNAADALGTLGPGTAGRAPWMESDEPPFSHLGRFAEVRDSWVEQVRLRRRGTGRANRVAGLPDEALARYLTSLDYTPEQRAAWRPGGRVDQLRAEHFRTEADRRVTAEELDRLLSGG